MEVMRALRPGLYEYQIAGIFSYVFELNGSHAKAYESLVASGPNSTIYHYSKIDRQTKDGDMVLMDMGAEFDYYASDITRALPVSGTFSREQREVYEIVLKMMDATIAKMKPGNTLYECLQAGEPVAKEGLYRLGLITDKDTKWQHYLYYFPYIIHGVGLDVHDVGDFNIVGMMDRKLEPGMVFAVEPLLYIGDNLVEAFKINAMRRFKVSPEEIDTFLKEIAPTFAKYKNIPARVEDNILITADGNENLSNHLPKTISEIEKTMKMESDLFRD
jgi:Xaa-Pro aminopeptidase